ncbi:MAG: PAS domain-containing protein [Bacillota bacterium]|nr:PAS domain-containing protein [Bacillota bacterium]
MANHTFALIRRGGTWQRIESAVCRSTQEALRQSEDRFAAAFHTTNAGFALVRAADDVILDANQAWLDMVGYPRDAVIGKTARDLDLYVEAPERKNLRAQLDQAGSIWIPELLVKRKGGQISAQSVFSRKVKLHGEKCCLETALARERELAGERDQARIQLVMGDAVHLEDVVRRSEVVVPCSAFATTASAYRRTNWTGFSRCSSQLVT